MFDSVKIAKEFGLTPQQVQARRLAVSVALWKSDFRLFARAVVKIRTKETGLDPMIFNPAQEALHQAAEEQLKAERRVRIIGLKGRQQGFSTYAEARGYWRATLWDRQNIYILSHEMDSTNKLFKMVELMQDNHPFAPAVGRDNAKELEFKARNSSYSIATAGQKAGGRGGNTSYFHGSEVSRWTNAADHFAASVETVPDVRGEWGVLWEPPAELLPFENRPPIMGWVKAPSEIWLETTSAGPTGHFYKLFRDAMAAKNDFRPVFVPWTLTAEYSKEGDFTPETEPDEDGQLSEAEYQEVHGLSDGQMLWRRSKIQSIGHGLFRQEYPTTVDEAFLAADTNSFIPSALVLRASSPARRGADPDAPLIVGVDPAGAGGDRFAIAWRRGDKCLKIEYRNKLEHDEAVAWICHVIDEDKPSRVCIDSGSMGRNIVSSIRALDPNYALIVRSVDFGGRSQAKLAMPNKSGPANRRAEIWGRLREWLSEGSIPAMDDLVSDLTGPQSKFRTNNDWLLESKVDMKARGVRSPDLADALALTFAVQEYIPEWANQKVQTGFMSGRTDHSTNYSTNYSANDNYSGRNGWMA